MTEQTNTITEAEATGNEVAEAEESSSPDAVEVAEVEDAEPAGKSGREAAKYRRQAREAEAERDTVTAQLQAARKQIVTAALKSGVTLDAILAGGHEVNAMFTETGDLDEAILEAAAQDVSKRFNINTPSPGSSALGRVNPLLEGSTHSFGNAFAPK